MSRVVASPARVVEPNIYRLLTPKSYTVALAAGDGGVGTRDVDTVTLGVIRSIDGDRLPMTMEARQRWFAEMLEAGLGEKILEPRDVLKHATPDVLANNLPADLMSRMLQASLEAGSMTPEHVILTVTPGVLAEHVPHDVLWACIAEGAERSGLANEDDVASSSPTTTSSSSSVSVFDADDTNM